MLKNIPPILSPSLLKYLCEMGHSDKLVIADGNFPVESIGKNSNVVRLDGHNVEEVLDAILKLFPLDTYSENSVYLMEKVKGDTTEITIWDKYFSIIKKYDERGEKTVGYLERFEFYKESKEAYLIIATSEKALYGNIILQKGVI